MTYNCFYCADESVLHPSVFPCYNPIKNSNTCVWYKVAQNDLEKLDKGDKNITLISMLETYLGSKIGRIDEK